MSYEIESEENLVSRKSHYQERWIIAEEGKRINETSSSALESHSVEKMGTNVIHQLMKITECHTCLLALGM